ncbi:hypothetical protein RJ641_034335 [Dillenia turbinata]|uniref:Uncharacterized protein n=1 Tax=Dillenia turbinata TaxID=194707 RepID=A0AAN8VH91_9MAGN
MMEVKLDESCVVVDSCALALSRRVRNPRSYKDAFASKRRLAKEYEQLAIWYGDIDAEFSQQRVKQPLSCFPVNSSSKNDPNDSDWELLLQPIPQYETSIGYDSLKQFLSPPGFHSQFLWLSACLKLFLEIHTWKAKNHHKINSRTDFRTNWNACLYIRCIDLSWNLKEDTFALKIFLGGILSRDFPPAGITDFTSQTSESNCVLFIESPTNISLLPYKICNSFTASNHT